MSLSIINIFIASDQLIALNFIYRWNLLLRRLAEMIVHVATEAKHMFTNVILIVNNLSLWHQ